MNLAVILQMTLADSLNVSQGAGELRMSYWDIAVKGGWVMLPIILLSIIAVYVLLERYIVIRKASEIDTNFMNRIRDYIHEGKVDNALTLCQSYTNPVSRMIEKGIQRIGRPLQDISTSIENVGQLEIYKLEKGLPTLATCAGAAPMLGFLGTVMGMIRAFYDISHAGNNINVSLLSTGMYQALVTTVAGLIVGLIAFFSYNYLASYVEKVVSKLEAASIEFMDLLNEPVTKK